MTAHVNPAKMHLKQRLQYTFEAKKVTLKLF